jgi:hypothetical protein
MESDRERGMAQEIAGQLARISTVESCDLYPQKEKDDLPSSLP